MRFKRDRFNLIFVIKRAYGLPKRKLKGYLKLGRLYFLSHVTVCLIILKPPVKSYVVKLP